MQPMAYIFPNRAAQIVAKIASSPSRSCFHFFGEMAGSMGVEIADR